MTIVCINFLNEINSVVTFFLKWNYWKPDPTLAYYIMSFRFISIRHILNLEKNFCWDLNRFVSTQSEAAMVGLQTLKIYIYIVYKEVQ